MELWLPLSGAYGQFDPNTGECGFDHNSAVTRLINLRCRSQSLMALSTPTPASAVEHDCTFTELTDLRPLRQSLTVRRRRPKQPTVHLRRLKRPMVRPFPRRPPVSAVDHDCTAEDSRHFVRFASGLWPAFHDHDHHRCTDPRNLCPARPTCRFKLCRRPCRSRPRHHHLLLLTCGDPLRQSGSSGKRSVGRRPLHPGVVRHCVCQPLPSLRLLFCGQHRRRPCRLRPIVIGRLASRGPVQS